MLCEVGNSQPVVQLGFYGLIVSFGPNNSIITGTSTNSQPISSAILYEKYKPYHRVM